MTPPFRLTFPRSASPAYPDAVRLAKQSPAYVELGEAGGRRVLHEAVFGTTADELGALTELWGLVQAWKGTRLEVDGAGILPPRTPALGRGPGVHDPRRNVQPAGAVLCRNRTGHPGRGGPPSRVAWRRSTSASASTPRWGG
jgi:hypothetical protein